MEKLMKHVHVQDMQAFEINEHIGITQCLPFATYFHNL